MITEQDIGKQYTLEGSPNRTYTLAWFSPMSAWCGVILSYPEGVARDILTVRNRDLRPLTNFQ